jgi:hypothetical protein
MDLRQFLISALVLALLSPSDLPAADEGFVLHDATPVRLRISRNLSSADSSVGETVDFEVLDDVKLGDTLIVARGATAIASVTQAQKKRRMGRGGKLDVNIDYVRAVNGDKIALRAVKETSGGGHVGAMTAAIVATSLIFFPAAPLFLFVHGKDITIPKGTELTAYTNGDIKLDPAKFGGVQGAPTAPTTPTAALPTAEPSKLADVDPGKSTNQPPNDFPKAVEHEAKPQLTITSQPNGAEIEINGEFIGNTPTTVVVKDGKMIVKVKKSGFQPWERTLTMNPGDKRTLNAEMESGGTSAVVKLPKR